MISITEAISDLLFVRDTVVVPGLGAFVKKPTSAKVNPVASYFAKPSADIEFDPNLREDNELLVRYLSEKNEIPEDEAKKLLAMFVSDCFNTLKNKKKVVMNGIGILSYDWAGDLAFEQDKNVNYNSDAFGLSDYTLKPVMRSKTKEEIKEEIAQQQKDKNTPMTVDEKAVHEHDDDDEDDDDKPRRFVWLWVLLGLLFVAGVLFGLDYFKVVDFKQWFGRSEEPTEVEPWTVIYPSEPKPWTTEQTASEHSETVVEEPKEVVRERWTVVYPNEVKPWPVQTVTPEVGDTIVQQPKETLPEPVVENPEANILIIAGCFGQEENAARLVNVLKEKGYTGAFYELRGTKWYVSFGRYATDEEATAALREIRKNTEYKAWILSR